MAVTINDVVENYDFLKSDEARQIFLDLEKIEFVGEEDFIDEDFSYVEFLENYKA